MVGVVAVAISVIVGLILGAIAAYYGRLVGQHRHAHRGRVLCLPLRVVRDHPDRRAWSRGCRTSSLPSGSLGGPASPACSAARSCPSRRTSMSMRPGRWGPPTGAIISRHIMPNSIAPIIVLATMSIGGAILTEAALSFLGMGVQPPAPSWGNMLSEARSFLFTAPWLMLYPGSRDPHHGARLRPVGRWSPRRPRRETEGVGCALPALLEVDDLHMHFFTRDGVVKAVDGVTFSLEAGPDAGRGGGVGLGQIGDGPFHHAAHPRTTG